MSKVNMHLPEFFFLSLRWKSWRVVLSEGVFESKYEKVMWDL